MRSLLLLAIILGSAFSLRDEPKPINEFGQLVDHLEERLNQEGAQADKKYEDDKAECAATMSALQSRIAQLGIDIPKLKSDIEAANADVKRLNKALDDSDVIIADFEKQIAEQNEKIGKLQAARSKAHAEFLVKLGDVDDVINALKQMQLTSLDATTKLSLIQLPTALAAKITAFLTTKWDDTDQESFDRLKQLFASLLDELFDYRGELEQSEEDQLKAFESALSTLNSELRALHQKQLAEKGRRANLEVELAGVEMKIADMEMKLDDLEEELKVKTDALADKKVECEELTKVYQTELKRRKSERETLAHLREVMAGVGPIEPHIAERIKKISVGGKAQIVCAETMQKDAAKIECPAGMIIHRVQFASYGKPEGECPNYKIAPKCHALDLSALQDACLGKATCIARPPTPSGECPPKEDETYGWRIAVVCQAGAEAPPPPPPPPPAQPAIPSNVEYKKIREFYIFRRPQAFVPTTDPCNDYKMHLISIHNDDYNTVVANAMRQAYPDVEECWIGLIYKNNGGWSWRDGTPLDYTHWNPGEPNGNSGEPQGAIWNNSPYGRSPMWNDEGRAMPCFVCVP